MKLLIDADFIVYKACAAAETEIDWGEDVILVTSKFSEAHQLVTRELKKILNYFGGFKDMILFFSDSTNFRKKIQSDYKGHRNRKKPCGYKRIINKLKEDFEVITMDSLEADDSMGIYATMHPGNTIVSPDKDMRQIPGQLYDLKDTTLISQEAGEKWHLIQTLAGDQTDGYGGAPGIGVAKAQMLFKKKGYSWKTVKEAFEEKDIDEKIALVNARLARILTSDDYDFTNRKPKLWTPSADYRINDGAGSETEVVV